MGSERSPSSTSSMGSRFIGRNSVGGRMRSLAWLDRRVRITEPRTGRAVVIEKQRMGAIVTPTTEPNSGIWHTVRACVETGSRDKAERSLLIEIQDAS